MIAVAVYVLYYTYYVALFFYELSVESQQYLFFKGFKCYTLQVDLNSFSLFYNQYRRWIHTKHKFYRIK